MHLTQRTPQEKEVAAPTLRQAITVLKSVYFKMLVIISSGRMMVLFRCMMGLDQLQLAENCRVSESP
jgi:hypothetical protein